MFNHTFVGPEWAGVSPDIIASLKEVQLIYHLANPSEGSVTAQIEANVAKAKMCAETGDREELFASVHQLFTCVNEVVLSHSDDADKEDAIVAVKALLFHDLSADLILVMEHFYRTAFKSFCTRTQDCSVHDASMDVNESCGVCPDPAGCICDKLLLTFREVTQILISLDLVDRLADRIVLRILKNAIEQRIRILTEDDLTDSQLNELVLWLESSGYAWLGHVYNSNREPVFALAQPTQHKSLAFEKTLLMSLLYESYGRWLVSELFTMIVDYPDSKPGLRDLRDVMTRCNLRSYLCNITKTVLAEKLLHPGVNTSDILTAYIQAIKTFRFLDSTGIILQNVCGSVCSYLRQRTDTVRCIITLLTDDCSDVALTGDCYCPHDSIMLDDDGYSGDDPREDWTLWTPDPVDADISRDPRIRKSADIVSMLVGIYGSKKLFVKEYWRLLAEKLQKSRTADVEKEIRYLELLKVRFGESELQQCEVMIKDVQESKRLDGLIDIKLTAEINENKPTFPVSTLIVSGQFWPSAKHETLALPDYAQAHLEGYKAIFSTLKANRTLEYHLSGGLVELELNVGDNDEQCARYFVDPVLACLIVKFTEKETWSPDELATELDCPLSVVRRRLGFWVYQGVLAQDSNDPDIFQLTGRLPSGVRGTAMDIDAPESMEIAMPTIYSADDDADDSMANGQEEEEDELNVYWTYISGLLKSMGNLTAERIHSTLNVLSSNPVTLENVKEFLETKVKAQVLVHVGGIYKLPRPS